MQILFGNINQDIQHSHAKTNKKGADYFLPLNAQVFTEDGFDRNREYPHVMPYQVSSLRLYDFFKGGSHNLLITIPCILYNDILFIAAPLWAEAVQ